MIRYERGGFNFILKIFRCGGSVFPRAILVAFPASVIAGLFQYLVNAGYMEQWQVGNLILRDNAVWSSFSFLVGFLIVFRTSQSYSRFWDGCTATHQIRQWWFNATSALCAFTKHSKKDSEVVSEFKDALVRLVSMLHAVSLAEIEDSNSDTPEDIAAFHFEVIDPGSIDEDSLRAVRDCDAKPELIFQWVQGLIVENIETGVLSIPPPILSRAFQELSLGMVAVQEAIKISSVPFPFPYAQTCDCLLVMHGLITPLVVSARGESVWLAMLFCFIQIFIMWTLNLIAVEIENPFGSDANDLDGEMAQQELNRHLTLLLSPTAYRTPKIAKRTFEQRATMIKNKSKSMLDIWTTIHIASPPPPLDLLESKAADMPVVKTSSDGGNGATLSIVLGGDGVSSPAEVEVKRSARNQGHAKAKHGRGHSGDTKHDGNGMGGLSLRHSGSSIVKLGSIPEGRGFASGLSGISGCSSMPAHGFSSPGRHSMDSLSSLREKLSVSSGHEQLTVEVEGSPSANTLKEVISLPANSAPIGNPSPRPSRDSAPGRVNGLPGHPGTGRDSMGTGRISVDSGSFHVGTLPQDTVHEAFNEGDQREAPDLILPEDTGKVAKEDAANPKESPNPGDAQEFLLRENTSSPRMAYPMRWDLT